MSNFKVLDKEGASSHLEIIELKVNCVKVEDEQDPQVDRSLSLDNYCVDDLSN